MFRSLKWRLLGSFALVIAVALGASASFYGLATQREIQRVEREVEEEQESALEELLVESYVENEGWQEVQPLVEASAHVLGLSYWIVDQHGIVVADSENRMVGRRPKGPIVSDRSLPLVSSAGQLGTAYFNPRLPNQAPVDVTDDAGPSINIHLLWGGLMAAACALLLTVFLSGRILAPVNALSTAARRLSKGDFSQRVNAIAKDEVGELAGTFNSMAEELGRAEEMRRNMVADVAHELRTPLTNVRGLTEAISDGVVEADSRTVKSIHEEVMLLARLVEDLQELTLAEAGQLRLNVQEVEISSLVQRAADAARARADTKNIRLDVDVPPSAVVSGDGERLAQVVRNLVTNAINYTPEGGHVGLAVEAKEREVEIGVSDTGMGISPEELPHIFERFYRVDKSRSRATGGVGLGLTIAKRLVEAHGGRIEVRSEVDKGTTFIVSLSANHP
jgi:signal transduction histidine kinase